MRTLTASASTMQLRGLKPVEVLAADRPHGDRLRYMAGCRCAECRKANSAYECERARARKNGDWNGLVPADKARAHILKLSRQNVGRLAVAAASDIAPSIVCAIRNKKKLQIRARTEKRILAVTKEMASDGALTEARKTWKLIDELIEEGYSKSFIAQQLGFKGRGIQISKKFVTQRNAAKVERLYRRLTT